MGFIEIKLAGMSSDISAMFEFGIKYYLLSWYSREALIKSLNKGWGLFGLDLNSGWN